VANKSAILSVKIVTDAKQGEKGLSKYGSRLDKFAAGAKKLAAPATVVIGGLAAGAKKATDLAAAAEQNVGAVKTVFGKAADSALGWSKKSADAVGLSASSYNELAASIGGSLGSAYKDQDELAAKTNELIGAASDLSSVFGGDTAEASAAMGAAMRGEFDSLERFGVFLNMSAVNAELAKRGQDKLTGAALDAAKKQATQNLIMQQAAKYQGNFAREADTAAGAQQRANAKMEDAITQVGEKFLPIMTKAQNAIAALATWVSQNIPLVLTLAGVLAGLSAAVLLVNGAIAAYRAIAAVATAAQWAWNAAMAANPIGLVILLIAGIVTALVLAYNKVGWFRDFVNAAFAAVQVAIAAVVGWFKATWSAAWQLVGQLVKLHIAVVIATVNKVKATASAVGRAISTAFRLAIALAKALVVAGIRVVIATVNKVKATASAVGRSFSNAWRVAVALAKALVAAGIRVVIHTVNKVKATASAVANYFAARFRAGTQSARNAVSGAVAGIRRIIDGIRATVRSVTSFLRDVFRNVVNMIGRDFRRVFNGITSTIRGMIGWVQNAIGWVGRLLGKQSSARAAQSSLGGYYMRPAIDVPEDGKPFYLTAAGPSLVSPSWAVPAGTGTGGTVQNVNIHLTVNGAVDAKSSARQIINLIKGELVSTGVKVKGEPVW